MTPAAPELKWPGSCSVKQSHFFTDNTCAKIMNMILRKTLYHFNMLPVGFTHSMKNDPWPRSSLCHYGCQMTVSVNVRSWRGYRFAGLDSGVMARRCCFDDLPVLRGSFSRLTMSRQ